MREKQNKTTEKTFYTTKINERKSARMLTSMCCRRAEGCWGPQWAIPAHIWTWYRRDRGLCTPEAPAGGMTDKQWTLALVWFEGNPVCLLINVPGWSTLCWHFIIFKSVFVVLKLKVAQKCKHIYTQQAIPDHLAKNTPVRQSSQTAKHLHPF